MSEKPKQLSNQQTSPEVQGVFTDHEMGRHALAQLLSGDTRPIFFSMEDPLHYAAHEWLAGQIELYRGDITETGQEIGTSETVPTEYTEFGFAGGLLRRTLHLYSLPANIRQQLEQSRLKDPDTFIPDDGTCYGVTYSRVLPQLPSQPGNE